MRLSVRQAAFMEPMKCAGIDSCHCTKKDSMRSCSGNAVAVRPGAELWR